MSDCPGGGGTPWLKTDTGWKVRSAGVEPYTGEALVLCPVCDAAVRANTLDPSVPTTIAKHPARCNEDHSRPCPAHPTEPPRDDPAPDDVPAWNRVVADLRREVLSLGAEVDRERENARRLAEELHDIARLRREVLEREADVRALQADVRKWQEAGQVLARMSVAEALRFSAWLSLIHATPEDPALVQAMARDALDGKDPP